MDKETERILDNTIETLLQYEDSPLDVAAYLRDWANSIEVEYGDSNGLS